MKDYRETIVNEVLYKLMDSGLESEIIKIINDTITVVLNDYTVTERSHNETAIDGEDETILKMFQGTLLMEGKSKKTAYLYIHTIIRMKRAIGKSLKDITYMDIKAWLTEMQEKITMTTCENYRSYLSSFYSWMTAEEFIEKNPMQKIKPIKTKDVEKFPYSDLDIESIKNNCCTDRERAEIELLLSSGVRVEELINLNIDDINFDTLEVHVRCGKGGKGRTTYMSNVCGMYLKRYLDGRFDDDESLFISNRSSRLSMGSVREDLRKIGERANVENVHPHRCRRTFATNLWHNGMDVRTIQLLLGHSNLDTTMRYIYKDTDYVKMEYKKYA